MAGIIHVSDPVKTLQAQQDESKDELRTSLAKANKQISSKYFYDAQGCELFNQITRHTDYYLTACEIEILNRYKGQLSDLMDREMFNLVELGPGEGIKTQILIEQFLADSLSFNYIPIDISAEYLDKLHNQFNRYLPNLQVLPIHSDYFRGFKWINANSKGCNLVLFLGSSIGNFDPIGVKLFLSHLHDALQEDDYLLLGFDLRKNIDVLMRAYNDSDGLTREFNLNMLKRLNREFGANFNIEQFQHYPTYNVYSGAMESYLISLKKQIVTIEALDRSFTFEAIEPVHVECSCKYSLSQIDEFAHSTGFKIIRNFTDSREYFIDALWQVKK